MSHHCTNNTRTSYSMSLSSGCSSTRTHALYFMLTNYYSMTVLPMLGKFTPRIHVLTLLRNRRSFPSVTPLQLPTFPRPPLFCACLHQVNHCTPHCMHRYKRRTCSSIVIAHYVIVVVYGILLFRPELDVLTLVSRFRVFSGLRILSGIKA